MKISSTNDITNAGALTVTADANSAQTIADITTSDFSTAYTSNGSSSNFTIHKTFTTGISCRYVGIAGHNLSEIGGTVVLKVNNVIKKTIGFGASNRSPNWVTMVHFDQMTATTVEIIITKTSTDKVTLAFMAIGDTLDSEFTFPKQNVAPAGFPKTWRTRSSKIRSQINDAGQPVANIRQQISRKTTLNLKNIALSVIQSDTWLKFLDMVYEQGTFFYKDEDGTNLVDEPRASVMAFQVDVLPPKMHGSTRQLVDLSIKFNAYTGS